MVFAQWLLNCNTYQILMFGGCVKVREALYTRVIFWVDAILNHIETSAIYLGMNVLVWYIVPNVVENKNILNYPYHIETIMKG